MRRAVTAAVLAVSLLAGPNPTPPGPGEPPPARSDRWRAVAGQALDGYQHAAAPTSFQAFTTSQALLAVAGLYGWDDPRIPGLITSLLAVRNPDGGWGIGVARDQFGDGSVNPASTTYTVTLAGHVGPALLAAYTAGQLADPEPLKKITGLLMSTPRINTGLGQCVAYSRAAADAAANYCVHNVNAGVADYLTRASAAGFGQGGLQKLVVDITRREISAYNPAWSNWPYRDGQTAAQDPDHGSYSAASLYLLTYPVGREAAYQLLAAPASSDDGRVAHLRLPALPGGPGSTSTVAATLWCQLGDQWLAEAATYVTSIAGDAMRLAQAAALAAADANACEEI